MANPNPDPLKARLGKKRKARPGSLEEARAVLWRALQRAGELLEEEDPTLSLRAVHAVSQCAASYAKVLEVGELEARLKALEAAQQGPDGQPVKWGAA